jgi:hypothetical protein
VPWDCSIGSSGRKVLLRLRNPVEDNLARAPIVPGLGAGHADHVAALEVEW